MKEVVKERRMEREEEAADSSIDFSLLVFKLGRRPRGDGLPPTHDRKSTNGALRSIRVSPEPSDCRLLNPQHKPAAEATSCCSNQ